MLSTLDKELKRVRKHLDEIELDRHKFVSNPVRLSLLESTIKKVKTRLLAASCNYRHPPHTTPQ